MNTGQASLLAVCFFLFERALFFDRSFLQVEDVFERSFLQVENVLDVFEHSFLQVEDVLDFIAETWANSFIIALLHIPRIPQECIWWKHIWEIGVSIVESSSYVLGIPQTISVQILFSPSGPTKMRARIEDHRKSTQYRVYEEICIYNQESSHGGTANGFQSCHWTRGMKQPWQNVSFSWRRSGLVCVNKNHMELKSLRTVDGWIFKGSPGTNTQATTVMLAFIILILIFLYI